MLKKFFDNNEFDIYKPKYDPFAIFTSFHISHFNCVPRHSKNKKNYIFIENNW